MSVDITYFVHGTTTDNEQELATGWLPGELSETGRRQAKDLGDMVAGLGIHGIARFVFVSFRKSVML